MIGLVILCFFLLALVLFRERDKGKYTNLPPGFHSFWDLLLFGIPKVGLPNYVIAGIAGKIHGPIFSAKLPNQICVGINDLRIAKQVMNNPELINRLPNDHILYEGTFKKPLGLLFSNGEHWKHSRRFTVRKLHELGFHRQRNMETFITFEVEEFHRRIEGSVLDSSGEGILSPHMLFEVHSLNIIWNLMAGTRFEPEDPMVKVLLESCNSFNRQFNVGATPVDFLPWLRHIPRLTVHDSWVRSHKVFQGFFEGVIAQRRAEKQYVDEPLDLIDSFLNEIDSHVGDDPNYYTDEAFIAVMTDMFLGGSDTTNSALEFAVLHMALNPEIQKEVQAEIDQFIGPNRAPCYGDKLNMVYTQAVLLEVLRYASAVPLATRSPMQDTQVEGYTVPKEAVITVNIHAIHFSTKLWDRPEKFDPKRFLSPEGKIVNAENIIPFGFGKRACIGEVVARVTLFTFFTSMLQRYSFSPSKGHPYPSLENICGLSRCPIPYHVLVSRRTNT